MPAAFRKHPALLQPYVAFLREALHGEYVAVVQARALLLPLNPRLAVFGDADAVAARQRHCAAAIHLESLRLIYRHRPPCSILLLEEQAVFSLPDHGLVAAREALGVLM